MLPCAVDHHWLPWLVASAVIIGYSFGISVTLPFFSTVRLQGIFVAGNASMTAFMVLTRPSRSFISTQCASSCPPSLADFWV
jgi:hypothetical protein